MPKNSKPTLKETVKTITDNAKNNKLTTEDVLHFFEAAIRYETAKKIGKRDNAFKDFFNKQEKNNKAVELRNKRGIFLNKVAGELLQHLDNSEACKDIINKATPPEGSIKEKDTTTLEFIKIQKIVKECNLTPSVKKIQTFEYFSVTPTPDSKENESSVSSTASSDDSKSDNTSSSHSSSLSTASNENQDDEKPVTPATKEQLLMKELVQHGIFKSKQNLFAKRSSLPPPLPPQQPIPHTQDTSTPSRVRSPTR